MAEANVARSGVKFDATINLGHILTTLILISTGFTVYTSIVSQINVHEVRLSTLERTLEQQAATNKEIALSLSQINQNIATITARQQVNLPQNN
jgi:hypothetical protein